MHFRFRTRDFPVIMSHARNLEGVFAVHKPAGITSAEVLRDLQKHFTPSRFFQPWVDTERIRRRAESKHQSRRRRNKRLQVKLGHGGTLDPMATGVLITGIGKSTKELNNFLACTKSYDAVVLFGAATDSYDCIGKVVSRAPYEHITRERVEEALAAFRGKIMQRPSIFSALRVQGKRLYEYAREGIEPPVEILKRPVEVMNLEIVEWYEGGTHDYVFPMEEVNSTEKAIAKKMVSKDALPSTIPKKQHRDNSREPEEAHGVKRKLSPSPASATFPKRQNPATDTLISTTATTGPGPLTNTSDGSPTADVTTTTNTSTSSKPHPSPPAVKLTMTVSSGFYVRSLAHDLGLALDSNAILSSLVRTRQADFTLEPDKVLEYRDLEAGEEVWGPKLQKFLDEWEERKGRVEAEGVVEAVSEGEDEGL
ncbi:tRNA pseudouridine(55) synthase [Paracoccidioides brasiliensis Pb18]|uniref:tRNA pseudouridine(55) synthase n=1 Tax=Paracoccidioides brasiliensis (strain Pb18) TaxID=502780 RepID=C1GEE8_PARBD|nr:tRNA pseudouridine(55) synthase [Paracoccidioides brasiliensis Pb18]EEH49555.2 tRNA pseudouridine(55) synthase [Paracoccidioides brasiliensis Pb18]